MILFFFELFHTHFFAVSTAAYSNFDGTIFG